MPTTARSATTVRRSALSPDGTRLSVLVATPPGIGYGTGRDSRQDTGPEAPRDVPPVTGPEAPRGVPPDTGMPPVLAVHGFASSALANWGRTGHLDALTRAGRVVIAPDLRGHGGSDRPHRTDAYTLPAVLADLVAVATQLAGTPDRPVTAIDLLGYSLGARLCWTLACQHLLPVRRMVLGGFDGRPLFQGVDNKRLDNLAAGVPDNDRVALRHLVAGLAGSGGTPAGVLPEVPTLLVAGDDDPLATRARQFAGGLVRGEFLPVPGRGHISAVPAAVFRQGVVRFLSASAPVADGAQRAGGR